MNSPAWQLCGSTLAWLYKKSKQGEKKKRGWYAETLIHLSRLCTQTGGE